MLEAHPPPLAVPLFVLAHVGQPRGWSDLLRQWAPDPFMLLVLLASGWTYHRGVRRLWRETRHGVGVRRWQVGCFWAGWGLLALAVVSPLHEWGEVLFAAHMTQHELLLLGAAPLLVLGRPLVAVLFALPRTDARQLSRIARIRWVRGTWPALAHPLVASAVHALALWTWHVPVLYQATLTQPWVHDLQHASFFGSALLFWWAVLEARAGRAAAGVGVLYLFATMMHSGLLGALITFADDLVYPAYGDAAPAWALTPLEDQQLGGLIMWVPAGLVYVGAALRLIHRCLRDLPRAPGLAPRRPV